MLQSDSKIIKIAIIIFTIIFIGLIIWSLIPEKIILQGEIEAKHINVSSKIPGRISSINVKKGDSVFSGDVLAVIETPELDAKQNQVLASLEAANAMKNKAYSGSRNQEIEIARSKMIQAKASMDLANKTNTRMQNLFKNGVISAQKADEAQTLATAAENTYKASVSAYNMYLEGARIEDKEAANANVKKAQGALQEINSYLDESKIIAPSDGEISDITAEVGELIGTGYPIFTIYDNNDIWATFNIKEDLLSHFKQGTIIHCDIPALKLKNVPMEVTFVAVRGNYATHRATRSRGEYDLKTFEVRLVPTEKTENLKTGMSVIIHLER